LHGPHSCLAPPPRDSLKPPESLRLLFLAAALSATPGCAFIGSCARSLARSWERSTVLGFLREKYDRNGDGRIDRDEYGRDAEAFARLDRDGDGSIGPEDFDHDVVPPADLVGPTLLVKTFGPEGADSISLAELERGFARLDRDRNGRFGREEFGSRQYRIAPVFAPDLFPWLVAGIDGDGDGALSWAETKDFFVRYDRDGNGRLATTERPLPGKPPRVGSIPPPEREPAPDFTLARQIGGEAVTLSSFAGRRPVALVFGSFT
jgi:EF hand domain-containing protein